MPDKRLRRVRLLAQLLTLLIFLVVMISAYLRLSGAGLGCDNWPQCYGEILASGSSLQSPFARIMHRVVATAALLLGFYLSWDCLRPLALQPAAHYVTRLVGLMIVLTMIGVWSSDPHRAWASFANMLGGMALVALSWRVVLATRPEFERVRPAGPAWVLTAGIAALLLTLVLGASIGARYAALACTTTPDCAGVWWPAASSWTALNPFVSVAAPAVSGDPESVTLHLLHRYASIAALLLMGLAGLQALLVDATRRTSSVLLALLAGEFALGSFTVISGFTLWLAIAHSALAAALLAAAMQLRLHIKTG
ncbi:MAG: COX15/CtaA family protein [Sulfuritalea sp.]|nr:COX15/CtaA family protein [Sulfuritalea sp.]